MRSLSLSSYSLLAKGLVEKPMVRLTNICEKLTKLLENQKESLTWHDGAIPESEVWVKVGGDHGQGSLKFSLALVNTKNPNSKDNNILIAMANIKDSKETMEIFFESIRKQLFVQQIFYGKGKKLNFFCLGITNFCVKYTVSLGNYPSLWCLTKKSEIQYKPGPQPERTLSSLSTDNKRFMNVGKGDKKNASSYNNSIHEPILDIPLDRVTPPYLHCLLGITKTPHFA